MGSFLDRSGVGPGSLWYRVWSDLLVDVCFDPGSMWDRYGIDPGSVRGNFGNEFGSIRHFLDKLKTFCCKT